VDDARSTLLPAWDFETGDSCVIFDLAHDRYDDVILQCAALQSAQRESRDAWARRQHRASEAQQADYVRRLRAQYSRFDGLSS
jgi:hypothetical protein